MNPNTSNLAAAVVAGMITIAPTMPAHAVEPVSTAVLAAQALATAAAATLGNNAVKECRVVWKHTPITVLGRRIGSTHLPQVHCNPK